MIKKLLPLIILTGLISIFFLRLFYPTTSIFMIPDFGESDVLHLNLPLKYILSTSLKNHEWPLWTPYLANGFPILAEGQIGTFYLPNLLLFHFLPLIWAYNLNLGLAYLLAATGMYLFTKKLGFSSVSAFFAAFIFTFSGFLSVHLNHFNLVQSASLLPFIFWTAFLLWRKPCLKYSILLAFFLSQQIFAGHFYIVFITLFGVILFWAGQVIFGRRSSFTSILQKQFIFVMIAFVFTFFLSTIQLLPTIELWQLSSRQSGLDFNTVTAYPFQVKNLLTFIKPYAFGNPGSGTYPPFSSEWGIFWENTAYIGLLPLFFALSSIIFLKNKHVKIFLGLLLISLLLVLGKNSPFYFIFAIFPFNLFRAPSKFLLLTTFTLSILSGITADKFIEWTFKTAKYRIRAIAFTWNQKGIIKIFVILILFLILVIDEYRFSYNYPPITPANWWTDPPEITKVIEKNSRISSVTAPYQWNQVFEKTGWQSFAPFVYFKNSLYPNYNVLFSIGQTDVNTGGLTPRRLSLFTALAKNIGIDEEKKEASVSSTVANVLSLSAVNYLISSYRIANPTFERQTNIAPPYTSKLDPLFIYKNNDALPRSYIVYNSKKIATVEELYQQLENDDFRKSQTVLVEDDSLLLDNPDKKIEKINIISSKPLEVILRTKSKNKAILVLGDTDYPGWNAYLDNKSVKIYPVNLVHRGILLPQGQHTVKFVFNPISFDLGKKITIVSWIIISAVVFAYCCFFPRKASGNSQLSFDRGSKQHSR